MQTQLRALPAPVPSAPEPAPARFPIRPVPTEHGTVLAEVLVETPRWRLIRSGSVARWVERITT